MRYSSKISRGKLRRALKVRSIVLILAVDVSWHWSHTVAITANQRTSWDKLLGIPEVLPALMEQLALWAFTLLESPG